MVEKIRPSRQGARAVTAAVLEFSQLMRRVAGPRDADETIVHSINRAARKLGLSRGEAKRFWYGERRVVPSELMDRARALAGDAEVVRAKDEFDELRARIARVEALLMASPDIARAPDHAVRGRAGDVHRAVDR